MNYPSNDLRGNPLRNIEEHFWDENFFNFPQSLDFQKNNKYISTDIRELENEYIIEAEIPGFSKDEIELSIDNGYLTISANRDERIEDKRKGYIRKERRYGHIHRSFKLENVKQENIEANFENGLLTIHLPKLNKQERKTKHIDIQ